MFFILIMNVFKFPSACGFVNYIIISFIYLSELSVVLSFFCINSA